MKTEPVGKCLVDKRLSLENLQRLDLQAGDLLVVKINDAISGETMQRIKAEVSALIPHHDVIVISGGMELSVLRPASNAA